MIEANMTWRFLPHINHKEYVEWSKKANDLVLKAQGLLEFRANRNLLGTPQVRTTTVWHSLTHWAKFSESEEWQSLKVQLLDRFAHEVNIELWGPSNIVPEPLRPNR